MVDLTEDCSLICHFRLMHLFSHLEAERMELRGKRIEDGGEATKVVSDVAMHGPPAHITDLDAQ